MLLLAVKALTFKNRQFLSQYGIDVVTPDTVTNNQIPKIVISYAWDNIIGDKILNNPSSKLKWIQAQSAGVDYLPLELLKKRGITVTNASGLKAIPIAQTVIGYILYFARGLNVYATRQHWEPFTNQYLINELPVLVFGTGRIGRQIASHIKSFGGVVYGVNTSGRPVEEFDEIYSINNYQEALAKVKIVVDGLPGTAETQNFFDSRFFLNKLINYFYLLILVEEQHLIRRHYLLPLMILVLNMQH